VKGEDWRFTEQDKSKFSQVLSSNSVKIFGNQTSKMHIFEAMFRQYLFISSLHILNKMSINLPFSSKCIREVDSIFRMTTFVKYTGTVAVH
jgi:hypothetical protein